jgi:phosphomannomutase/phosphoglucomutase
MARPDMMNLNPLIFREYDIRGTVGIDLNKEFAFTLGRAYGTLARDKGFNRIGIGYDCRLSSAGFASELARGIATEKIDVVNIGMGPTPQLYFAIRELNLGGGIQVTGSHNPPDMNGFKLCLGTHTLSGPEIQDLLRRVRSLPPHTDNGESVGVITNADISEVYKNNLIDNCRPHYGARKLKVVCDGGNGVGGLIGPDVLRALGAEVIELYCEPDGRFPNHHPDPTDIKSLTDLRALVRESGADLGIGWDGDADRIGVVDEQGEVLFGDMLLLIYARAILEKVPGATIIGDVKCSSLLFDDLKERGANGIMWKTGHSLIKGKLNECNGELAGEMSGHIFFKHRYYGFDDALYASLRLLEILSNTDKPLSALLEGLPKMYSTPEIRVDCPEDLKFKVPSLLREHLSGYPINDLDGVRIQFPNGWGLVRASNTQPVLVLRFEATSLESLNEYQSIVNSKLAKLRADSL